MLRDIAPCDDARSPSVYSPTGTWPRSCMIAANGRAGERGTDGRAQAQSGAGDKDYGVPMATENCVAVAKCTLATEINWLVRW